jgi:hypothetical protein
MGVTALGMLLHTPRAKHVFLLSPADVISVIKENVYSEIMYAKVFKTLKIVC